MKQSYTVQKTQRTTSLERLFCAFDARASFYSFLNRGAKQWSHTDGDIIIEPVSETIIDRHVDAFFYVYLARFDWVSNNIFTLLLERLSFFTSNRRMASS